VAAVVVMSCLSGTSHAQVPIEKQVLILTRSLAYDNNLRARVHAGDKLVVAVLWKAGNPGSESAADAPFRAFKAIAGVKVQSLPLSVVKVAYSSKDALKGAIAAQGIDVLYCGAGLEGDLSALREVSHQVHVLTLAAREEFVHSGLSMGVFSSDGKPTIMVNLAASKEEGASLSSDLLHLATVTR
jgi:NAD(P)-dependent dehydrogenase (short-subunit alcohol dehydrogenase family)